eukprot:2866197-Pleurochrysis_carterae.AAC.1
MSAPCLVDVRALRFFCAGLHENLRTTRKTTISSTLRTTTWPRSCKRTSNSRAEIAILRAARRCQPR